jgi:hypothetical protein
VETPTLPPHTGTKAGGSIKISPPLKKKKKGQVRSGQVRSGQVRSGQVRSGQVRSGQVRSWSQFRTRALERPAKCFRCQEFGHLAADCKSAVEKKEACYRCGGPGHFARNCKEEAPKCYSCGESGHLARSMRCRNYKAAVDQIRRQDGDRKPNRRTSQSAGQD